MDVSVVSDATKVATHKALGFAYPNSPISINHFSISDPTFPDVPSTFQISSSILAPPRHRISRRTVIRKKRRIVSCSGEGDDGGEEYIFSFSFDGGDGFFNGNGGGWGGGGNGGNGWNFDRFGEQDWDESSSWFSSLSSEFVFGFMHEVIYWIALSNCMHFAFKKIVRLLIDELADEDDEKGPLRFAAI